MWFLLLLLVSLSSAQECAVCDLDMVVENPGNFILVADLNENITCGELEQRGLDEQIPPEICDSDLILQVQQDCGCIDAPATMPPSTAPSTSVAPSPAPVACLPIGQICLSSDLSCCDGLVCNGICARFIPPIMKGIGDLKVGFEDGKLPDDRVRGSQTRYLKGSSRDNKDGA